MQWIIKTSLQYRFLILIIAVVLVAFGVIRLSAMPVDVLPEFSPTYVEIQTEALGLSAEEVEALITVPLEQDLLNGVAWLEAIRSESVPGLSSIVLFFEPGTDLYRARQLVAERLTQAFALPHVSKAPTMLQPKSATSRVMLVGLSSKDLSLIQMSVLARWTIAPRLMGVPGVSNVAIWGLRDRQLQVQVDPERLRAHDVSLLQVLETTGNALWVSTLTFLEASTPGNAGFIDTPQQRLGIQHILPIVSPEGLAQVSVEGSNVRLIDVANVVEDHQPLIGDAQTGEGTGLILVIDKFPGSNTLQVTRDLEHALNELKPGLTGMQVDSSIYRPATFIELATDNLTRALLIGLALVVLVLGVFFFEWRSALISLIAIPLSLLAGGFVLYLLNATVNVMILAGFIIAIGVIVDDAIIGVDNVLRRLQYHRERGSLKSTSTIVFEATLEMRNAVFFATLIILLAVLAVFFLEGLAGAFFQPLALSFALAVLASMVVALTVTPALCLILMSNLSPRHRVPPLVRFLRRGYRKVLGRIAQRPVLAFAVLGLLLVIGLATLPFLSQSLLPTFKESDLIVQLSATPGTSQPEMSRIVAQVSNDVRAIPGVSKVGAHVGRAIFGDQVVGINSAELWVNLAPDADHSKTVATIQSAVNNYPGLAPNVQTFLEETSNPVIAAPGDDIVVRIYGHDYAVLQNKAEELKQALVGVNGLVDTKVTLPRQEPTLEIEVDLAAAQRYGIKPGDVRRAAATMLNGLQVGNLFEEQKVFDVVVWSTPQTRSSLTDIRNLLIDTPSGERVRLGNVAHVTIKPVPTVIQRENVSRYLDVSGNLSGRDYNSVKGDVERAINNVQFPLEYHAEFVGDYATRQAAWQRIVIVAAAALVGIFLVMQAALQSWKMALLSFVALPLTLVGGLVAALVTGGVLTFGSLAGFLAVLTIAVRNMVVLLKHLEQRQQYEGNPFGLDLVLHGSSDRLAPILMTALAVGLGLLPMVVMGDIPGLEVVRPMAIVIIGSLVTATLVNLFVMPTLYLRFGKAVPAIEPLTTEQGIQPGAVVP
ncbi:MAG: efflux RND transporter permease subunit [Chloroflexota bacterium]|nr:MAG: efflux RND transporter permease subunit [Chloroflexota bacterium]